MSQSNVSQENAAGKRVLSGTVVSAAMNKTIVVKVLRKFKHPVMGKTVGVSKKYKVHDEENSASVGDIVEMVECRPLSKEKHMRLRAVLQKAN